MPISLAPGGPERQGPQDQPLATRSGRAPARAAAVARDRSLAHRFAREDQQTVRRRTSRTSQSLQQRNHPPAPNSMQIVRQTFTGSEEGAKRPSRRMAKNAEFAAILRA